MSEFYAWEASGDPRDCAHAVGVIAQDSIAPEAMLAEIGEAPARRGDRNNVTLCGLAIGWSHKLVAVELKHSRFNGLRFYLEQYTFLRDRRGLSEDEAASLAMNWLHDNLTRDRFQIRTALQLHRASEIANQPRCKRCLATLDAMKRNKSQFYYRRDADMLACGPLPEPVEWTEDMPLFEGEWAAAERTDVRRIQATTWPGFYYRWRIDEDEARRRLIANGRNVPAPIPVFWAPQALMRTLAELGMWNEWSVNQFNSASVTATASTNLGYVMTLAQDQAAGRAGIWEDGRHSHRRQAEIQDARMNEMERRTAIVDRLTGPDGELQVEGTDITLDEAIMLDGSIRSFHFLKTILTPAEYEEFSVNQYVDVASTVFVGRGYRVRPWKRIGLLKRTEDGGWREMEQSYCVHPDDLYPPGDEVASLYLQLKYDEVGLIVHTANLHNEPAVVGLISEDEQMDALEQLQEVEAWAGLPASREPAVTDELRNLARDVLAAYRETAAP